MAGKTGCVKKIRHTLLGPMRRERLAVVMDVLYKLGLKLSYWEVGWSSLVGTFHYYSIGPSRCMSDCVVCSLIVSPYLYILYKDLIAAFANISLRVIRTILMEKYYR